MEDIVRKQQWWIGNFALFMMFVGALIIYTTTEETIKNAYLSRSVIISFLIVMGLFIFYMSRRKMETVLQTHLLSLMLLVVPITSISFLPYAAVTVWASSFLFLMIALISYQRIMMWYAIAITIATSLYVMWNADTVTVEIDPTDHYGRIGMIVIGVSIALVINHLHIRNLNRLNDLAIQLHDTARRDEETGVLNRQGLNEIDFPRPEQQLIFVGIHLENYYELARYFGEDIQLQVLRACIERLKRQLPPYQAFARIEAGTLLIVMEKPDEVACKEAMEELSRKISVPYEIEGHHVYVNISIVIDNGEGATNNRKRRVQQLLTALQEAAQQNERVMCIDKEWRKDQELRVKAAQSLAQANIETDFHLVYQLQYDVQSEQFIGLEALVRWKTPLQGADRPSVFIPIAEKSDLIIRLGEWIFEESCKTRKALVDLVPDEFTLSVNVSPRQLTSDSFMPFIERTLLKYALKPQQIKIEITESQSLDFESQSIHRALKRIKTLDFPLSLDDFGTGHASYHVLERLLPLRQLKIPKQFIEQIGESEKRQSILESIFQLSQSMHVECIVEGVETGEEVRIAKEIGIHLFQGYFFAKPVSLEEIICLLQKTNEGTVR
ncbi:EAL domain-containing protein [Exiguobacterium sp. TBG-PICH-001]|uniref:bifunctional diguanylate cyclase/phosphodiesterase n=1 Tax=Exiguobacterium abrahamii TaxID=2785532 RepID=UPI0018A75435|nr:bifunctional diguanylate cyclase/phosphodiesterase [Exiguobacterium sp. TBG-PICH-001]MBF8153747.1 EAL domain-containing protein [Exiguobacterium sp. TBG-PICH-001]